MTNPQHKTRCSCPCQKGEKVKVEMCCHVRTFSGIAGPFRLPLFTSFMIPPLCPFLKFSISPLSCVAVFFFSHCWPCHISPHFYPSLAFFVHAQDFWHKYISWRYKSLSPSHLLSWYDILILLYIHLFVYMSPHTMNFTVHCSSEIKSNSWILVEY